MSEQSIEKVNERSLLRKVSYAIKRVSKATIGLAVTMFYTAKDKDTPKIVQTAIFTAIAYFILPIDSIPDFIPGFGFSDDISLLSATFTLVASHIKNEHITQATEKISKYIK